MTLPSLVKNFLLKPKFTTSLIILGSFFSLLAVLLPQISTQTPGYFVNLASRHPIFHKIITFFSLNQIFSSLWFFVFLAITSTVLALSLFQHISVLLKGKTSKELSRLPYKKCAFVTYNYKRQNITKHLNKICQRHNFSLSKKVNGQNSQYLQFHKNWLGRWGTPLLHSGLILLIFAGLYGAAFYSRGFVQIIKGETVNGHSQDWLQSKKGFLSSTLSTDFNFTLVEFNLELWPDKTIKKMQSILEIRSADSEKNHAISTELGAPATVNNLTILQAPHFGYAVSFVLKPENRPGIPTSFMLDKRLETSTPPSISTNYPLSDLQFDITLYDNQEERVFKINQPLVLLTITNDKNSVLFKGDLQIGSKVDFSGYDLYLTDIQFWSGITAIKGYGIPLVYLSFLLIFLGCTLHYMLIPRTICFKLNSTDTAVLISIYGKSYAKVYSIEDDLEEISINIHHEIED